MNLYCHLNSRRVPEDAQPPTRAPMPCTSYLGSNVATVIAFGSLVPCALQPFLLYRSGLTHVSAHQQPEPQPPTNPPLACPSSTQRAQHGVVRPAGRTPSPMRETGRAARSQTRRPGSRSRMRSKSEQTVLGVVFGPCLLTTLQRQLRDSKNFRQRLGSAASPPLQGIICSDAPVSAVLQGAGAAEAGDRCGSRETLCQQLM